MALLTVAPEITKTTTVVITPKRTTLQLSDEEMAGLYLVLGSCRQGIQSSVFYAIQDYCNNDTGMKNLIDAHKVVRSPGENWMYVARK